MLKYALLSRPLAPLRRTTRVPKFHHVAPISACSRYLVEHARKMKSAYYDEGKEYCERMALSQTAFIRKNVADGCNRCGHRAASAVDYDSFWIICVHVERAALKLNLDPSDVTHLADRIGRKFELFARLEKPPTFLKVAAFAYFQQRPNGRSIPDWMRALFFASCQTCGICGKPMGNIKETHGDHAIPWKTQPMTKGDNMQITHASCNLRKGAKRMPSVFGMDRALPAGLAALIMLIQTHALCMIR